MSNFNKQVGKIIDKATEEKLKSNWKKTKILTRSSFIGSDILNTLLKVPGAVGLRVFYGMDDDGNMQPIFFACDQNGNVIKATSTSLASTNEDSGGADASVPCPPICGSGDSET